jgi:outer membrane protein TolC
VRVVQPILILFASVLAAAPATAQERQSRTIQQGPTTVMTNPFLGGVPTGEAGREPIMLTVIDAIRLALTHNLGLHGAEDALGRARGSRRIALSDLLPNVSGHVSETRQIISLAAFGFNSFSLPGFPAIVGPFNVFDARLFVSQSIFDLEAINSAREESHLLEAARLSHQNARNFVINVAGDAFLQALEASARVEAARAQLDTADALHRQAVDMKEGGMIAGIDVLRARVQLATEQQRFTAATNDFEKTKLGLAHIMGLPLGQAFTLNPDLPELPYPDLSLERAFDLALRTRPDYQAALERVRAADAERASVAGSNRPSVHVNADIGEIGVTPNSVKTTYGVVGSVNVPIFNGGRTQGRRLQADTDLRARREEAEDLKASIYYEVRAAFLDLEATTAQLSVATSARDLAAQQLVQARDRFGAGIANNVDVVQAQGAVALATEQFIAAQYGYDRAKGAFIRGVGTSEEILRQISGGGR